MSKLVIVWCSGVPWNENRFDIFLFTLIYAELGIFAFHDGGKTDWFQNRTNTCWIKLLSLALRERPPWFRHCAVQHVTNAAKLIRKSNELTCAVPLKIFSQIHFSSVSVYSVSALLSEGLRRPSPRACVMGHVTALAVNAALVASQWQHRAWTVSLHSPINAEHEAGQAASIVLQDGMTRPGIESNLAALVVRAQPTGYS